MAEVNIPIAEAAKKEAVDHPSHYGGKDDPYEHIKVCEAKGWNYHVGNVTKYLWRLGKKDDPLQEAKKAQWYLNRYVALLEQRFVETKRLENLPK